MLFLRTIDSEKNIKNEKKTEKNLNNNKELFGLLPEHLTKRRPTIFNCDITPVILVRAVGFNSDYVHSVQLF